MAERQTISPKETVELYQRSRSNERKLIPMSALSTLDLIMTLQRNFPINKAVLHETISDEFNI